MCLDELCLPIPKTRPFKMNAVYRWLCYGYVALINFLLFYICQGLSKLSKRLLYKQFLKSMLKDMPCKSISSISGPLRKGVNASSPSLSPVLSKQTDPHEWRWKTVQNEHSPRYDVFRVIKSWSYLWYRYPHGPAVRTEVLKDETTVWLLKSLVGIGVINCQSLYQLIILILLRDRN